MDLRAGSAERIPTVQIKPLQPKSFHSNEAADGNAICRSPAIGACRRSTLSSTNLVFSATARAFSGEWTSLLLLSQRYCGTLPLGNQQVETMKRRTEIQQGTRALMVLKTLDVLGPQHGFGIARRVEQISGEQLALNQATSYPLLLRLEQEGVIGSDWGHQRTIGGPAFAG